MTARDTMIGIQVIVVTDRGMIRMTEADIEEIVGPGPGPLESRDLGRGITEGGDDPKKE